MEKIKMDNFFYIFYDTYPQFNGFYTSGEKKVFLEQGLSTLDFGKAQIWN